MSSKSSGSDRRRGSPLTVWLLGALSLFGLIGFVVAFGLVMARTTPDPHAAIAPGQGVGVPQAMVGGTTQPAIGERGPRGESGPPGPQGPRGPAGDAGIRIVRHACGGGDCSLQCEPNEVLLTAHCGVGRAQAIYPTERSALCRSRSTARVEVVAACVKNAR